jgi:hypothetical protein
MVLTEKNCPLKNGVDIIVSLCYYKKVTYHIETTDTEKYQSDTSDNTQNFKLFNIFSLPETFSKEKNIYRQHRPVE